MRRNFYILILLLFQNINAQKVQVSLFNSTPVKGMTVALYQGNYFFYCNNELIKGTEKGKIFYITLYENRLLINNANGPIGCFDDIYLISETEDSKLQLYPFEPKTTGRIFSGNIHLKIEYGRILLLNEINIEQYIAGVVEAEAGINAYPEFYKAQALLCRTYLYSHLVRHESEGFNLCDEVHCQAYKGITPFTSSIYQSTVLTRNKVIVSSENNFITASFHANCGGETESSLNTWLKAEEYLLPVKDPYCVQTSSAHWEKKIPLVDWKKYLNTHGIKTKSLPLSSLVMKKKGRQMYYRVGKDSILSRQIRSDWNLRSSYFEVTLRNNYVIIKGHGYGHGVGLCQEGAMNMATLGKTCDEIINFYFKGTHLKEMNNRY